MKSLQTRILIIFSVLIVISTSLIGYVIYSKSTKLVTESVGEQAKSIAEQAVKSIDIELYKNISPEKGETAYYKQLRLTFNEIKKTNHLKYLYTMVRKKSGDGYEYYYVVDGAPLGDKDASALGEKETIHYEHMLLAFETGKPQAGEMSYDKEYGANVTAYVPIKDNEGRLIGIAGADYDN